MAIRRITAADIPQLRTWWDAYKASGAEYANEPPMDAARMLRIVNDAGNVVLVDTVTKTLAICVTPGRVVEIQLMFTLTAGAAAARTAVDRMMKAIANGAITYGSPLIWGAYDFPAGMDVETTRAVRYFNTLCPPGTKTVTLNANGTTNVRFECTPAPLLAALTARTP